MMTKMIMMIMMIRMMMMMRQIGEIAVWMYGCTVVSYVTDRRSDHD